MSQHLFSGAEPDPICGQCDAAPATVVVVTVNGWIIDCCPRCAVLLCDPIGALT